MRVAPTHTRRRARVARATTPRDGAAREQLAAVLAAYDRTAAALPRGVLCCLTCAGYGPALDAQDRRRAWIAVLARKVGDVKLARAADMGAL